MICYIEMSFTYFLERQATFTSVLDGNFISGSNWGLGPAHSSTDNLGFASGNNVTLNASRTIRNFIIEARGFFNS